jgi:prepilin-type N-terminal cleavage/methylation domain-containing protein
MKKTAQHGFTLVELLIAMALFLIVVSIAVGGFVNALHTQREVAALIAAQSNAGLALEQMARDVRTGYLFCHDVGASTPSSTCGCVVTAGPVWTCDELSFYNAQGANAVYARAGQQLTDSESGNVQPVTGSNVAVKYLKFTLFGNIEGDTWNPRVTISMGVSPSSSDPVVQNNLINLQTTVSAREIDCDTTGGTVAC